MKKFSAITFLLFAQWAHCLAQKPKSLLFTRQDSVLLSLCSCDSIMKRFAAEPRFNTSNGIGFGRLYNFKKQLSKCGYFYNYKLICGYDLIYDNSDSLTQIARYFNGRHAGDCEIKKGR